MNQRILSQEKIDTLVSMCQAYFDLANAGEDNESLGMTFPRTEPEMLEMREKVAAGAEIKSFLDSLSKEEYQQVVALHLYGKQLLYGTEDNLTWEDAVEFSRTFDHNYVGLEGKPLHKTVPHALMNLPG